MLRKIGILLLAVQLTACTELQNITGSVLNGEGELTSLEIGNGLKAALNIGISKDAATSAKPIFVSAIKEMTFQDATAILMVQQDVAKE